jgi:hypothetical protein
LQSVSFEMLGSRVHVMRRYLRVLLAAAASAASVVACNVGGQDPAAVGGHKELARYDVNEDGWLSGSELESCSCAAADRNGDGEVTAAELGGTAESSVGADDKGAEPVPGGALTQAGPEQPPLTPPARPGAADVLPLGDWFCTYGFGRPPLLGPGREFKVLPGGRYAADDGEEGTYSQDPNTGRITFQGGFFGRMEAEGQITPGSTNQVDITPAGGLLSNCSLQ